MSGHRKYGELRSKMSPARRARNERAAETQLAAMELDELRRARSLTQEELAQRLGKRQESISRVERRDDVHVSTLRDVVEAMGGELVITARFADGEPAEIRISQYDRTGAGV